MSHDRTIDYETFRKSRLERLLDWRRNRIRAFHAWWNDAVGRVRQRGWSEAQAEVVTSKPIRFPSPYRRYGDNVPSLAGWAITFKYAVNGKSYDGVFTSPDEAQPGDSFSIRFNPDKPDQNNTLDSELGWFNDGVVRAYDIFMVLLFITLVAAGVFLRLRS